MFLVDMHKYQTQKAALILQGFALGQIHLFTWVTYLMYGRK